MSAERVTHSRNGAPPCENALRSKSTCSTAPLACSSSAARAPQPAVTNTQPSTATTAACGAREGRRAGRSARGLFGARGLAKEYALRILGDGVLSVDGRRLLVGTHRRRPFADAFEPAPEVLELLEPLPLRLVGHDPGVAGDVGDRVLPGNVGTVAQAVIEHTVQPVGLPDVALDGVGDLLRRIAREVMVLPGHG